MTGITNIFWAARDEEIAKHPIPRLNKKQLEALKKEETRDRPA